MIHSGVPTPEKKATHIIPLEKDYYSRRKINRLIFKFIKEKITIRMKKISSLKKLQSKEKAPPPSSIGVESIQVSTETDHLSNVLSKLTPE